MRDEKASTSKALSDISMRMYGTAKRPASQVMSCGILSEASQVNPSETRHMNAKKT